MRLLIKHLRESPKSNLDILLTQYLSYLVDILLGALLQGNQGMRFEEDTILPEPHVHVIPFGHLWFEFKLFLLGWLFLLFHLGFLHYILGVLKRMDRLLESLNRWFLRSQFINYGLDI